VGMGLSGWPEDRYSQVLYCYCTTILDTNSCCGIKSLVFRSRCCFVGAWAQRQHSALSPGGGYATPGNAYNNNNSTTARKRLCVCLSMCVCASVRLCMCVKFCASGRALVPVVRTSCGSSCNQAARRSAPATRA
jgi:hypothetical protein